MATLVRRLFKVTFSIGLFLLAVRLIGTNGPMKECEALRWLDIAHGFGLREPDDVYIPVNLLVPLIFAIWTYRTIFKLWRSYRAGPRHGRKWPMSIATLAGWLCKAALLVGLLLVMRSALPSLPSSACEPLAWADISYSRGEREREYFHIPTNLAVSLIFAVLAYRAISKTWQRYRQET
ncbi:hypothetical protein LJ656_26550 [Paraburkholderia sp. MMS20-SJTR3]|uniref:Uncharacterized protein n=1 Tax=Paraburkholderia sejongensis TaxID=2886946 RepID=A0ABS8K1W4_9BURK|nr:hypothetical protein [Paraburkholderia sp. MMS20-SJTR3]MCC8396154.1 hypothetical protein [Paraburkholderia sp. MMS20-SJTR3]